MNSPFWRSHLWWPLAGFALLVALISGIDLDLRLAGLFFDAGSHGWLGAGAGDWWAHRLLHGGGRWVVRAVAAAALSLWLLSWVSPRLHRWRRDAGFVAAAMLLAVGIVGALKAVTNVDCPWDLGAFGGHNPLVPLFSHRPDYLPRARCFPGAHSSSGFALLCFYFLWRDRSPAKARVALWTGLLVGGLFALGQEARGAHFLSHDLSSLAIVWLVQLGWYAALRGRRLAAGGEASAAPPAAYRAGSGWR
jgi:membrane-associated PAP2 superfamily phosphatase